MSHVFLIGFMGAGKSTVGRIVSTRAGLPFLDLDELIKVQSGRNIPEIFATDGEAGFRRLERAALESLRERSPSVVACGGGIVLAEENRATLARMGRVIYLKVSADEALARIGKTDTRPLLSGDDGSTSASALLESRKTLYRLAADDVVETEGRAAKEVAGEVIGLIGGFDERQE